MKEPGEPIHPFTVVFILAVLVVGISIRTVFTHGFGMAFALLLVGSFLSLMLFGIYEMLHWAPDDPRWELVSEELHPDPWWQRFP